MQPRGSQDSHHVKKFTWGEKNGQKGWKLKRKGKRARRGVTANLHKCYGHAPHPHPPLWDQGEVEISAPACACGFGSQTLRHILLCFESTRRVRCRRFSVGVVDAPREGWGGGGSPL